eukprot:COSAG05_NODE_21642_length_270_cov_0.894737_1_plen_72_part_01
MEALKQAAAADARFKSALKVDAGGDAGKLQSVLDNFVVAMDLLEKAQAAETKDKIKAALQEKHDINTKRLGE